MSKKATISIPILRLFEGYTLQPAVVLHLQKYWKLCRRFFEEADYALAAFFAITLIEEVGKVVVLGVSPDRAGDAKIHHRKYSHAVLYTLVVNSRVSRVYKEDEAKFAQWFKERKLFAMRNSSLYFEVVDDRAITPEQVMNREDAFLLVCIAGEVLADAQGKVMGTGPEEWARLIAEVDAFRETHSVGS